MADDFEQFWAEYQKTLQEASGGGGIVCKVWIGTGYKVFPPNIPQVDTFFAARTGDMYKTERKETADKATALAAEYGLTSDPRWKGPAFGLLIRAYKDGAFSAGNPVTWTQDRFFFTQGFTDGYKNIVEPSIFKNRIRVPFEGWVHIGFKDDPYAVKKGDAGKTNIRKDENGEVVSATYPTIAYIIEVFPNEAAAQATIGTGAITPGSIADMAMDKSIASGIPEGWDEESWADVVKDVKAQNLNPALSRKYLQENYSVDLSIGEIVKLLK